MNLNEEETRTWLDVNNQALVSEIEKKVPIKFTLWEQDCYATQIHKNEKGEDLEVEIFYKKPISQAKIAHELLHAKVALVLGDNWIMLSVSNQHSSFTKLMTEETLSGILNACEHIIIYNDYLNMGYSEEVFFEEESELEDSIMDLNQLERDGLKKEGEFYPLKVYQFLFLAFSFLFFPVDSRFKKEIKQLRKINFPLFSRVQNLRNACIDLEIVPENKEYLQHAYLKFATDLNEWIMANIH